MSGISKKLMGTTAAGGEFLAIEDVFSTYLYTGNGSTQTITNGIDLAGEGGLVWGKNRTSAVQHALFDTERGQSQRLATNLTSAQVTMNPADGVIKSFNNDGFTLDVAAGTVLNDSGNNYASWTFRKAPRFFDVVTYTGNGVAGREIAHNLGQEVGCLIVKRTNLTGQWAVYHRSINSGTGDGWLLLSSTNAASSLGRVFWGDGSVFTAPTDSGFTVSDDGSVNESGGTYVAYLFAHDPLGPSEDGSDGLIACGSFVGNTTVNLGWEPQWILLKRSDSTGGWFLHDTMRGWPVSGDARFLYANTSDAEGGTSQIYPNATGFSTLIGSGTYIYIAIRRGPMRVPASGTEVFDVSFQDATNPSFDTGFVVDAGFRFFRPGGGAFTSYLQSRLTGTGRLSTTSTDVETTTVSNIWDFNDGWGGFGITTTGIVGASFRRAPGFFDVVAYTGNGVDGRTVPHNLTVAPEMIIIKRRDTSLSLAWKVLTQFTSTTLSQLVLNETSSITTGLPYSSGLLKSQPTDTSFEVSNDINLNASGGTYIAYLFTSLAGVSKVGSYSGNGSSQTIDCGFTTGARFILIKEIGTGDWYVWDTARGIVTGNDPHLSLNTTAAEVTTDDSIDPESSGFIVNQLAATNINVSAASYIFYAVS